MIKETIKILTAFFILLNASAVFATALPSPLDSTFVVKEVVDHQITAVDMAGMQIMVNGSTTAIWDGSSANGSNNSWTLTYTGTDTIGGFWKFSNEGFGTINTVKFDAFGADAVFDVISKSTLTENSEKGALVYVSGPEGNVPSFNGPVRLEAATDPAGDIYRWLTFDFSEVGGLSNGQMFQFIADTDKVSAVPIPPAAVLFFSGIVGLIGLKRRNNKQIKPQQLF